MLEGLFSPDRRATVFKIFGKYLGQQVLKWYSGRSEDIYFLMQASLDFTQQSLSSFNAHYQSRECAKLRVCLAPRGSGRNTADICCDHENMDSSKTVVMEITGFFPALVMEITVFFPAFVLQGMILTQLWLTLARIMIWGIKGQEKERMPLVVWTEVSWQNWGPKAQATNLPASSCGSYKPM